MSWSFGCVPWFWDFMLMDDPERAWKIRMLEEMQTLEAWLVKKFLREVETTVEIFVCCI